MTYHFGFNEDLHETTGLAASVVIAVLVFGLMTLEGLEIKCVGDQSAIAPYAEMQACVAIAQEVTPLKVGKARRGEACQHCLEEMLHAFRSCDTFSQSWEHFGGIGIAVRKILSTVPDASDEEIIALYRDCAVKTNAILDSPDVWPAIGRVRARLVVIGEISENRILFEAIRTLVPGSFTGAAA